LICPQQETAEEIAEGTMQCLLPNDPAAVPGIVFLSGGQSSELASERLNAMNLGFKSQASGALSFCYGRTLQQTAMDFWKGLEAHVAAARQTLSRRAHCNHAACRGSGKAAMESGSL
jgi:fructose-bisphosphate aldolase class I